MCVRKKITPALLASLLTLITFITVEATSLSTIKATLDVKLELETKNGKIEILPVKKCYFYKRDLLGLPVTLSQAEVITIPASEVKNINLIAKEGTFFYLSPRIDIFGGLERLTSGIKDPVRFRLKKIDLSGILKCKKSEDTLNCTIEISDLLPLLFKYYSTDKQACIMFVNKNEEDIENLIIQMSSSYYLKDPEVERQVYNQIAKDAGVRVFCLIYNLVDSILQKEKEKEKKEEK